MTRSDQTLAREEHALPKTVSGVLALVGQILRGEGAVQRLVIENDQPVRVFRWKDKDPMEEDDIDLDGALRNADMLEYANENDDKTPEEVIFHMTHILRSEGAHPVCWAISQDNELLPQWLRFRDRGLPGDLKELLFVEINYVRSLPEETIILAGASSIEGGVHDISVAVKATMEIRRDHAQQDSNQPARGERGHPEGGSRGAGSTQDHPRGALGGAWSPSSYLRRRLSG